MVVFVQLVYFSILSQNQIKNKLAGSGVKYAEHYIFQLQTELLAKLLVCIFILIFHFVFANTVMQFILHPLNYFSLLLVMLKTVLFMHFFITQSNHLYTVDVIQ